MPRPLEYDEIIDNLVKKTEEGKLSWSPTVDENTFVCVLEGEFTLKIVKFEYQEQDRVALSMPDKANSEIFLQAASSYESGYGKLCVFSPASREMFLNTGTTEPAPVK
jgi:hypothetical protein